MLSRYHCMRRQITFFGVLNISGGGTYVTHTTTSRSPLWMLDR